MAFGIIFYFLQMYKKNASTKTVKALFFNFRTRLQYFQTRLKGFQTRLQDKKLVTSKLSTDSNL